MRPISRDSPKWLLALCPAGAPGLLWSAAI
jgi:hypothetical protein